MEHHSSVPGMLEMDRIKYRSYNYSETPVSRLEVCPHIDADLFPGEDNSEYIETITIHCKVCKKEFDFDILIN